MQEDGTVMMVKRKATVLSCRGGHGMGKGKVGVPTSTIENTRNVSATESDCKNCFHSVSKDGVLYCKYYDLFSPKKKKCVRYSFLDKSKSPHNKVKKVKKEPTFPWETP